MGRAPQTPAISIRDLILFALLAVVSVPLFAQSDSAAVPENARAKEYGKGWVCNQGYRAVNDGCTAIKLPANAYPTNSSYGSGWKCGRGYREANGDCAAVTVPDNAYSTNSPYGNGWRCERGYREFKRNLRSHQGASKCISNKCLLRTWLELRSRLSEGRCDLRGHPDSGARI